MFIDIHNEFFNDYNMGVLKNNASNKNLKFIVCFVYNVVTYILGKDYDREDQT